MAKQGMNRDGDHPPNMKRKDQPHVPELQGKEKTGKQKVKEKRIEVEFLKDINKTELPMQAMKDIPTPNENAQRITALVKEDGRVTGYQLSNGQILDKDEGVRLARQGGIQGVGVATNKGEEYLKSLPDGAEENNLSNLPSITR